MEKIKIYENVDQRSLEWYKLRNGRITGSIVKDFMSKKGTITRTNAILKKAAEKILNKSEDEDLPFNINIDRGIQLEPIARNIYSFNKNVDVKEVGFVVPLDENGNENEYIGCSPDGLVGEDGIIEIKAPNNHIFLERMMNNLVPKDYMLQIQFNLWVTGRQWCDFINYNEDFDNVGNGLLINRVKRNEELIEDIKKNVDESIEEIKNYYNTFSKSLNNINF